MSNIISDILFVGAMFILAVGNYVSLSQVENLQKKFNNLNLRVKSLERSRIDHEDKIAELNIANKSTGNTLESEESEESEENEQGC